MDLEKIQPHFREIEIREESHVLIARRISREFALAAGFDRDRVEDIVLCTSELSQNHLDHKTTHGKIRLFSQRIDETRCFMSVSSLDEGPGILDFKGKDLAFSPRRGLKSGLNCVKRLSDDFSMCSGHFGSIPCPDILDLEKKEAYRTVICASFWSPNEDFISPRVKFSYLICPHKLGRYSGDGISIVYEYPYMRLMLMDVLGKGEEAAKILCKAKDLLERIPPGVSPKDCLFELGKALLGTQGLMAQLVLFDFERDLVDVFAIGDVSQFVNGNGKGKFVVGNPGVIGKINVRNGIFKKRFSAQKGIMGIMFSDGLKIMPRIKTGVFAKGLKKFSPLLLVNMLFEVHREQGFSDDASLLIWQWKS